MKLQEITLNREQVFKGKFLKVDSLSVRLPNGKTSQRECVIHPGACAIVALNDKGEVIIEKQYRASTGRIMLEIPSGIVNYGEDFLSEAKRELEEETGYTAKEWIDIGKFYPASGYSNQETHFYIATGLNSGVPHLDEDEFLSASFMPFNELLNKVLEGEIEDANTNIAIIRAGKKLGKIFGAGGN